MSEPVPGLGESLISPFTPPFPPRDLTAYGNGSCLHIKSSIDDGTTATRMPTGNILQLLRFLKPPPTKVVDILASSQHLTILKLMFLRYTRFHEHYGSHRRHTDRISSRRPKRTEEIIVRLFLALAVLFQHFLVTSLRSHWACPP